VKPSDDTLHRLPKAELHMHLDGSLRPATMLDLAYERDVEMPADTAEVLGRYMVVSDAASLEEYLERFEVTLSVMQDADALERIAYECVVDHAAENVRYVELRFCPLLNTLLGTGAEDILDAALAGMRRAEADTRAAGGPGIRANLIVCALRSHTPAQTLETAELAIAFRHRGVCGFDIAGAEAGNPVSDHAAAFDLAHREGLPITIHAGEGFGAASIRQAIDIGHARRIGHGTRLFEDRALLDEVRVRGIPLEVCLTSNLQTRVVPSYAAHPAKRYLLAGIPVSLGTDNRLMSGVTLTDEYVHARTDLGLSWTELRAVARAGFEHAFLPDEERAALLAAFDTEVALLG
jgi:adenosine deaminase